MHAWKRPRMLPALAVLFIGACASMEGKWSVSHVDPTAARRDFAFDSVTLQQDGTFYAEAHEYGDIVTVSGTWSLNEGILSLEEQDGERHTYDARLVGGGNRMELIRHWNGRRLTATLDRQSS